MCPWVTAATNVTRTPSRCHRRREQQRDGQHTEAEGAIGRARPQWRGLFLRATRALLKPNVRHACNCTQAQIRAPHCPVVRDPAHRKRCKLHAFGFHKAPKPYKIDGCGLLEAQKYWEIHVFGFEKATKLVL